MKKLFVLLFAVILLTSCATSEYCPAYADKSEKIETVVTKPTVVTYNQCTSINVLN